jgi:putative ABC transport system ATP-binding protein
MINIRNLAFHYPEGDFSLSIEDFQLQEGEKVAVIGPSGCGKTTLLNLVSGIVKPDAGEVHVASQRIDTLSESERRAFRSQQLGFVFQDFRLVEYLSVLDNIIHLYRISSALRLDKSVITRARVLAEELGLSDLLDKRPMELSQGERQRAAICRSLLSQPRLILADEATGNLDPMNKKRILSLLFDQVAEQQASLLAVTHDHELLPYFDRVVDFQDFHGLQSSKVLAMEGQS